MDVLQSVTLSVPGNKKEWIDTGVSLKAGESLHIHATGTIRYSSRDNVRAHPEGSYQSVGEGFDPYHAEQPNRVNDYASGNSTAFTVPNLVPFALVALVANSAPAFQPNSVTTALRPNRDRTFGPANLPADGGRVFLAFNDSQYEDNRGAFEVTVERLGEFDP
ncbi:hypothetical protein EON80_17585, partial [bacterium]